MGPAPPLPVPPMAARTPYSLELRASRLPREGARGKLWDERSTALPLWPQWTSAPEAAPAGSWTASRPGPSPHSRGQGTDPARAKAALGLTLHPAPTGCRRGAGSLPGAQLSPAGLGATGALGSPALPDLQLVRKSCEVAMLPPPFTEQEPAPRSLSLSPAPRPRAQWE